MWRVMFNFTKWERDQSIFLFDQRNAKVSYIMLYTMADVCVLFFLIFLIFWEGSQSSRSL